MLLIEENLDNQCCQMDKKFRKSMLPRGEQIRIITMYLKCEKIRKS